MQSVNKKRYQYIIARSLRAPKDFPYVQVFGTDEARMPALSMVADVAKGVKGKGKR